MFKTCSKSTHIFNHVIWARGHCGTKHQLHHFKIFSRLYNNVRCHKDLVSLLKQLQQIVFPVQYRDYTGKIKGML